jgi:hypothetical protein
MARGADRRSLCDVARNDWQNALNDDDLVAVGASRGQGRGARALRWLVSLFVIAAVTFAGAFYVPLKTAHDKLTKEYAALAQKHESVSTTLTKNKEDLASTEKERTELKATVAERKAREEQAASRLDALEAALKAKLTTAIKNETLRVEKKDGEVVAAVASESLTGDDTMKLTAESRVVLCEVAKRAATETGVTIDVEAPLAVASASGKAWASAATRSAFIAQLLDAECRFPSDRLSVRSTTKIGPEIRLHLAVSAN